ncbi:DUF1289 domain-containing protein [Roseibium sediminis]|uniref:DUF1289 domain-containing protein n=1 Tax=Roseibium sediminis TaxID=1775174 RepID=UPI00123D522B|nr:DUF1289 domain-containing protein [Roseibium sediminis]
MTSPCTKVCQIDQTTRLCRGCFRSLEEIATWGSMSEADRARVMAVLEDRRASLGGE